MKNDIILRYCFFIANILLILKNIFREITLIPQSGGIAMNIALK